MLPKVRGSGRARIYTPHGCSIQSDSKNANKPSLARNRRNPVPMPEAISSRWLSSVRTKVPSHPPSPKSELR